jgi:hypothetical protein
VQTERIALAASDRHHAGSHRSLAAVHELVTRLCGAQMADRLLIQNPGRVLAGERIDQPEPRPLATRGRWSRLFRRPV